MAHDPSDQSSPAEPRMASRHLLLAGLAGACVMGVGLGLWARPAMNERRMAVRPPAEGSVVQEPARRSIRIVIDDRPAPLGAPIEVLPAAGAVLPETGAAAPPPAPEPPAEPRVPTPAGLVRVQSIAPSPAAAPRAEPRRIERAARVVKVKAKAPARTAAEKAKDEKVKLARSRPRRAEAETPRKARVGQRAEAVRREPPRSPARAISRVSRHAQAAPLPKLEKVRLEKARPAKARLKKARIEKVKPETTRLSKARLDHPKGHKPSAAPPARLQKAAAKPASRRPVAQPVRPSRSVKGEGPLRLVSSRRCATMACGDPAISAADRQMNRAYADARAAGVPDARLRQQQQHWQTARATAAREAPWAVHDVYLARIAELNDQARAQGDGY